MRLRFLVVREVSLGSGSVCGGGACRRCVWLTGKVEAAVKFAKRNYFSRAHYGSSGLAEQVHGPAQAVAPPAQVGVPAGVDFVEELFGVEICGVELGVALGCLPLEALIAVPVVLVRDRGVEEGEAEFDTGLHVGLVGAVLLAFEVDHLHVFVGRVLLPVGLADEDEATGFGHFGQGFEGAFVALVDPGAADAGGHGEDGWLGWFVGGSVHVEQFDALGQSAGSDFRPGLGDGVGRGVYAGAQHGVAFGEQAEELGLAAGHVQDVVAFGQAQQVDHFLRLGQAHGVHDRVVLVRDGEVFPHVHGRSSLSDGAGRLIIDESATSWGAFGNRQ